jgi:hypothetical protein
MDKKAILKLTFKVAAIGVGTLLAMGLILTSAANFQRYREIAEKRRSPVLTIASNPENTTYVVDGAGFALKDGMAAIQADDVTQTVTLFGPVTYGDLDGDGDKDAAVILMMESGGTGRFTYVAAAIKGDDGFAGTNAVFVGDRISPQTTGVQDGIIVHNYADRLPWEPFVAQTSVGKTKRLKLENGALKELAGPTLSADVAKDLATKAWGDCKDADCATFTVNTLDGVDGVWYVQATYDGFMDDSIKAERRVAAAHYANGTWVLGTLITETRQCREGRGHQEFSSEPCI